MTNAPEIGFAAATIKRLDGDYFGALTSSLNGIAALLRLPLERSIWLHNLGLWLLYVLFLTGGLFVALQMATKGGALFYDLARFMSPPMALPIADMLTVLALVWPLVLPSGLIWLAIYWSILLWGYGSVSEKVVFYRTLAEPGSRFTGTLPSAAHCTIGLGPTDAGSRQPSRG